MSATEAFALELMDDFVRSGYTVADAAWSAGYAAGVDPERLLRLAVSV